MGDFRGSTSDQALSPHPDQRSTERHSNFGGLQNPHYGKGYKQLKNKLSFDPCLETKVDLSKVKMEIMKPWITQRVTQLMGMEDELVINFVFAQLEPDGMGAHGMGRDTIDPKDMQINLMGFMERKAAPFMTEMWSLLISASKTSNGIPPEFLEKKKAEIRQKKEDREKLRAEIIARKAEVEAELAMVRQMEEEQEALEAAERGESPPRKRQEENDEKPRRDRSRSRSRDRHRSPDRDKRRDSRRDRDRDRDNRRDSRRSPRRDERRRRSPSPRRRSSPSPRKGASESRSQLPARDGSPDDGERRRRSPNPTPIPSESVRRSPEKDEENTGAAREEAARKERKDRKESKDEKFRPGIR